MLVEGTSDPTSLGYSYELLARLVVTRLSWYEAFEGKLAPPPIAKPHKLDDEWSKKHRTAGEKGLKQWGDAGFMEIVHYCPKFPH